MTRLRKTIALVVTASLAIAAVASLALALLTVVDDLRRPPMVGPLNVSKALRADSPANWSLFAFVGFSGEISDGAEWSCSTSVRNGGVDLTWYGKRCYCGELRPTHAPSCIETSAASVTYSFSPVFDERAGVLGIEWGKGWFFGSGYANLSISYWTLLALFAPYPLFRAIRWYRRRRRPGFCACGYDLTGNVSGTCPECGSPRITMKGG